MRKKFYGVIAMACVCLLSAAQPVFGAPFAGPGLPVHMLGDTAIIEDDIEDDGDDTKEDAIEWELRQEVSAASCKQGKDVTLTVSLSGDTPSMQLSTIYVKLAYDPKVFQIAEKDITPVNASQVDYLLFDADAGELDIYYADDIRFEKGAVLLKIKLHVRGDADTGATKIGVKELELYATDSEDYSVVENGSTLKVNIKKQEAAVLLGDVNQDKKISLADVKLVMKYCNEGKGLTAAQKKNADVNRDGKVTLTDAKLIMKYCNGELKKF